MSEGDFRDKEYWLNKFLVEGIFIGYMKTTADFCFQVETGQEKEATLEAKPHCFRVKYLIQYKAP